MLPGTIVCVRVHPFQVFHVHASRHKAVSMLVSAVPLLKTEGSHGGLTKTVTGAWQFFKVAFIKCHVNYLCPQSYKADLCAVTFWSFYVCAHFLEWQFLNIHRGFKYLAR